MTNVIELTEEDLVRNRKFNTMEEAIEYGRNNLGDRPFIYGKEISTGKWIIQLFPEGTKIEIKPIGEDNADTKGNNGVSE